MEYKILNALTSRRTETRARWETLLRIEGVNTPLANPDALVHLFDWTLDEVFLRFSGIESADSALWPTQLIRGDPFACECGRNPFVAYFKAAKQALMEALVLEQSKMPRLDPIDRDLAAAELRQVIETIGQSEVEAFCALCVHRPEKVPGPLPRPRGFSIEED